MSCKIVVLISGNGSNLQAIIDAVASGTLPVQIAAVISNVPGAYGLERAKKAGIPAIVIDHKTFPSRDAFDAELLTTLQSLDCDLIVLAGFMRILGNTLVETFTGKMLNLHPSLLPKYPGLHTHQRAIDAGDTNHGCSIHFVTHDLDGGPVVAQARLMIKTGENADNLAARVHQLEHQLYPEVLRWYATGRLTYQQGQGLLDGKIIA